ncbi:hypothetical protein [Dyella flagellata]|uniref:Uncharacterized protein n=1 Tax=Dyella flagellata TaxID=1867833 RepID=A0ABQ5XDJ3_9GAMM|nr:hypothetical protein [Dyella flagellata]GLQ89042.1 hypothetical protein GCM10007898_26140 [Dyella flagellata]
MISELKLFVEASNGNLKWQEPITLHRLLPGNIAIYKLEQIPTQNLWVGQDGGICCAYDAIGVHPLSIVRDGLREEFDGFALPFHPTHFDIMNGKYLWWGGRRYHIGAFKEAQLELLLKLRYHLVGFNRLGLVGAGALLKDAVLRGHWRRIPAIALFACLSAPPVLATSIWASIMLRRSTLLKPMPQDACQHVLRKGNGCYPTRRVKLNALSE